MARRHVYLSLIFLDEGRKLPLKDTMTLLITTVLIMTILMTLNTVDITRNDISFNLLYLDFTYDSK